MENIQKKLVQGTDITPATSIITATEIKIAKETPLNIGLHFGTMLMVT